MTDETDACPDAAGTGKGIGRPLAGLKFVVILGALLATAVAAIESSRRMQTSEAPFPAVEQQPTSSFPRKLADAAGQQLRIVSRPKRIVSQTLATDEILLAICPAERIAALSSLAEDDNYSNVVDETRRFGLHSTEGAEQILRLQPDLIFVASYSRAETVELLKASKAPAFRFANFDSINDIQKNIRTVGYAIGNDDRAEALVKLMDEALAAARSRVPPHAKPPRVMSFGHSGYTAGAHTTFDAIVRAAGAINVGGENGIDGFVKISPEKIADWKPDVLVVGANRGEAESARRSLLADPIIAASPVGVSQRIIVIDNRHLLAVSQYVVKAVEDLADGLYGKLP